MDDGADSDRAQSSGEDKGRGGKDESEDQDKGRKKGPGLLHNPLFLIAGAVVLVVLIVGAILWWLHARQFESTDDAYVDTQIVHLAPQVPGQVQRVLVTDNQSLQAGQLLVEIEPSQFHAQVQQAEANRAQAISGMAQAEAQVGVDQAKVQQAQADERAAAANAVKGARDLARYQALRRLNAQAVSQEQLDQYAAQAANTADQRDAAARAVKAAASQLASTRTQIAAARAKQQAAEAQLRQQGVNLSDTKIVAPVAGTVAHKTVAAGDYVQAGQELMAIVPRDLWVTANFKETQLPRIRVGQAVDIRVDGCKGVTLDGRIDSVQRGAGQAFALLPAENATGNFVKVVQRVPVKITFKEVPRGCVLGPGMSVSPKVRIR
jgi:membrane fusion protein (multidrug efflux system)